jgi:rSAM/selenodomain-associated transferase 1
MDADSMDAQRQSLLLIQFSRAPQEGRVKTRMMPFLSAVDACELHCELTLWTCRQLLECGLGDVEISVAGDTQHALFARCQAMGVTRVSRQRGADLGHRMYDALNRGLAQYTSVILVGSDCPGIDSAYLQQAVMALHTAPVVLGPATDGGYVLIGARTIMKEVFQEIPWGGDQVYARTGLALARAGLCWTALPLLTDIDRPEDLPGWEALKRGVKADVKPARRC